MLHPRTPTPQVYHRDVLGRLKEGRVEDVDDVEWLRVVRFYQEGEVVARVGYSQVRGWVVVLGACAAGAGEG